MEIADGMFNDLEDGVNRMSLPAAMAEASDGSAPPGQDAITKAKTSQDWRVISSMLLSFQKHYVSLLCNIFYNLLHIFANPSEQRALQEVHG